MGNIRIQIIGNKFWMPVVLVLLLRVTLTVGNTVEIDVLEDLQAYAVVSTCEYFTNYTDICRNIPPNTDTTGFWSSCGNKCGIIVVLGDLVGNDAVPIGFDVLTYVAGRNSQIIISYARYYGDDSHDLQIIQNTVGWATTTIRLDDIPGLTSHSEIVILMQSDTTGEDIDVVDKITFIYTDPPVPTTTTVSTTMTTISPTTTTSNPNGPCATFCTATDRFGENWIVCSSDSGYKMCPYNANGNAVWYCQANGEFRGSSPDYTSCFNGWIEDIEKEIDLGLPLPSANATEYIERFGDMAREGSYFGHEIRGILYLISRVLSLVEEIDLRRYEDLTDHAWDIFGIILSGSGQWEEMQAKNRSITGAYFVTSLESSALELAYRAEPNVILDADSLYRRSFSKFDNFRLLSGVQLRGSSQLRFPEEYSTEESHLDLPSDWEKYFEEDKVHFVGVEIQAKEANLILPAHLNNIGPNGNSSPNKFINSKTIGFSFGDIIDEQFNKIINRTIVPRGMNFTGDEVRITLRHVVPAWGKSVKQIRRDLHEGEQPKAVIGSAKCVFWDPKNLIWSSNGCSLISTQRDETTCTCDHLTSFAVLMDVHTYIGKDLLLEILTLTLCSISILSLVVSLCILFALRSDKSPRNELTINLCICLLLGNLLMVFVMDKHYFNLGDGLCIATAVLLHYTFLCAIMWMALEGFFMFRILYVDIYRQGKDYIVVQHVIAYGIPIPIVAVTGLVHAFNEQEQVYGNDTFCWLNGSYIWAFMGPMAAILTLNLIVLILALRKAYNFQNNPHLAVQRKAKSCLSWIKTSTSLSVLLGVTWISGFFMVIDNSDLANIAAYTFTVLNASQGIFLLISHGVMNPKLMSAISKRLPKWSKNETVDKIHKETGHSTSPSGRASSSGFELQRSNENLKDGILRRTSEDVYTENAHNATLHPTLSHQNRILRRPSEVVYKKNSHNSALHPTPPHHNRILRRASENVYAKNPHNSVPHPMLSHQNRILQRNSEDVYAENAHNSALHPTPSHQNRILRGASEVVYAENAHNSALHPTLPHQNRILRRPSEVVYAKNSHNSVPHPSPPHQNKILRRPSEVVYTENSHNSAPQPTQPHQNRILRRPSEVVYAENPHNSPRQPTPSHQNRILQRASEDVYAGNAHSSAIHPTLTQHRIQSRPT